MSPEAALRWTKDYGSKYETVELLGILQNLWNIFFITAKKKKKLKKIFPCPEWKRFLQ